MVIKILNFLFVSLLKRYHQVDNKVEDIIIIIRSLKRISGCRMDLSSSKLRKMLAVVKLLTEFVFRENLGEISAAAVN
jgi:hypothetical protein